MASVKSRKWSKTATTVLIVAVIALIAIALPIRHIMLAEGEPGNNSSSRIQNTINYLGELLANKTLPEESRESIELRKRYFEWQATQMAQKTESPERLLAQKQTLVVEATREYLSSTPMPTASRPVGIMKGIDYVRALEREATLSEIFWVGKIKEAYVIVYTGALRNDPAQGVVFVFPEDVGRWLKFLTPDQSGPVTITNFEGNRLTLMSDKGVTVFFDVAAQKFMNSADEALPTATNTPYPPYPGP